MLLYRDDVVSASPSVLPVERKPLICVLGVPNHMTSADFCQFCGSFIQHILEMRITRFDSQDSTDHFYKHFNGTRFSSLEAEVCCVFFTVDVQYTRSIEHTQASPASSAEQPTCPVCLGMFSIFGLEFRNFFFSNVVGVYQVLFLSRADISIKCGEHISLPNI
ncbi:hypothetical protein L484_008221 [Morus notabilis]|uniref:BRCA1-associated 2/ETP1 RRM domain-containing protein n=1 Tax=Morus notabilis TaxID=981085 RepID=W9S3I9_9ROSA|nr:hypothetical protein L484_008221 [Morus notabilis]